MLGFRVRRRAPSRISSTSFVLDIALGCGDRIRTFFINFRPLRKLLAELDCLVFRLGKSLNFSTILK